QRKKEVLEKVHHNFSDIIDDGEEDIVHDGRRRKNANVGNEAGILAFMQKLQKEEQKGIGSDNTQNDDDDDDDVDVDVVVVVNADVDNDGASSDSESDKSQVITESSS